MSRRFWASQADCLSGFSDVELFDEVLQQAINDCLGDSPQELVLEIFALVTEFGISCVGCGKRITPRMEGMYAVAFPTFAFFCTRCRR